MRNNIRLWRYNDLTDHNLPPLNPLLDDSWSHPFKITFRSTLFHTRQVDTAYEKNKSEDFQIILS